MKLKKLGSAVVLFFLCTALFSGCGSVKSAWVAARMGAALKSQPITAAVGELNGTLEGKTLGISNTTGLHVQFQMKADQQARKSFSELKATVSMLGMEIPQNYQIYQQAVEGKTEYFVHLLQPDLWARTTANWDSSVLYRVDPSVILMLAERISDQAQIYVDEIEGESVYRLQLVFSARELGELINAAGLKLPAGLTGSDFSAITAPVELEISRDSYLPRSLRMKIAGLNGEALEAVFRAWGRELKGTDLSSGELTLKLNQLEYGPQTLPELPPKALTGAAKMEELFDFLQKFRGGK